MGYNRDMSKKETKTSKVSGQIGRFAPIDLEKPFGHRARKQADRGRLKELLAKAFESGEVEVGVVLGTLQFLLGKAQRQVSKSSFKEAVQKDAAAAATRLLTLLRDSAPETLSARVVIEDGQLKAEAAAEDPRDQRSGLHPENQAVLYPGRAILYPHSNIVRLYK